MASALCRDGRRWAQHVLARRHDAPFTGRHSRRQRAHGVCRSAYASGVPAPAERRRSPGSAHLPAESLSYVFLSALVAALLGTGPTTPALRATHSTSEI